MTLHALILVDCFIGNSNDKQCESFTGLISILVLRFLNLRVYNLWYNFFFFFFFYIISVLYNSIEKKKLCVRPKKKKKKKKKKRDVRDANSSPYGKKISVSRKISVLLFCVSVLVLFLVL